MIFREALEAMKCGENIRRPGWVGYWRLAKDIYSPTGKLTIHMHCKNGEVLDIRHTQDVIFTVENMAAEDWEVVGKA